MLNTLGKDIKKILRASKVKLCIYSNALPNLDHPNWKPLSKLEMINLMRTAKLSTKRIVSLRSHPKYFCEANGLKSKDKNNFSEAYNNLGNAMRGLNKQSEALSNLKQAIKM